MCRFIESICFQKGQYNLLHYHQKRVSEVYLNFFPKSKPFDLLNILNPLESLEKQKVRVVFDDKSYEVSSEIYQTKQVRRIQLLEHNEINYDHKFEKREELKQLYDRRGNADDILIIKNGLVTDSYYANPAFWDGKDWYAPKTCLLNGVKRQYLLETGQVKLREIAVSDIRSFEKVCLVNAMLNLDEVSIPITEIMF